MKRVFVFLLLLLYAYNILGYLAMFYGIQRRVKSEMWQVMKADIPETNLVRLVFHTSALKQGAYPLTWIDDHEFRYNDRMYDIIRSSVEGDSSYFLCINDVQEEQLFSQLHKHVQQHTGDSGQSGKLDPFKDLFKESLSACLAPPVALVYSDAIRAVFNDLYCSIVLDVPSPPPRPFQETHFV